MNAFNITLFKVREVGLRFKPLNSKPFKPFGPLGKPYDE